MCVEALGAVLAAAAGASLDRLGAQEAVAGRVLQQHQELGVEVGALSHGAPP